MMVHFSSLMHHSLNELDTSCVGFTSPSRKLSGKICLHLWEGAGKHCFSYSCVLFGFLKLKYFLNFLLHRCMGW